MVPGSWTVPTVQPGPEGYSSSWLGIDGAYNNFLIQAGTEQDWAPQGVQYYAWYELIPAQEMYLGAVFPGDQVTVIIDHVGTSAWEMTIEDVTCHQVWRGAVSYTAPGRSAEALKRHLPARSPTRCSTWPTSAWYSSPTWALPARAQPWPPSGRSTWFRTGRVRARAYPGRYRASTDLFGIDYGRPASAPVDFPAVPLAPVLPAATTTTTAVGAPPTTTVPAPPPSGPGYWLMGLDGGIFGFGSARYYGSTVDLGTGRGQSEITGMASTPDGRGYWLVSIVGGVFPLGDAKYYGSLLSMNALEWPVDGIEPTADGKGYYMVGIDGSVYAFGDAHFDGACGTIGGCGRTKVTHLVLGTTANGYSLLASNCAMFAFGDAPVMSNFGCESHATAAKEIAVTAAPTPDGQGYWVLLATTGQTQSTPKAMLKNTETGRDR